MKLTKPLAVVLGGIVAISAGGVAIAGSVGTSGSEGKASAQDQPVADVKADQIQLSTDKIDRKVKWGSCPEFSTEYAELPQRRAMECGTLTVPVDYRAPQGRTIDLAVSRLASTKPQQRRGVLLMNPGGPGQPGLEMPLFVASKKAQALADGYDLIGFDPRGVGRSAGFTCGLSGAEAMQLMPTHPVRGADDVPARVAQAERLANQCKQHDPNNLQPHLSTANNVRDMDVLRRALGEDKISYLGWSYGTFLGAAYAEVFTGRTDRVVLDGVVDPTSSWQEVYRKFGEGGEKALAEFTAWAAQYHDIYGLGTTPDEVRGTYFKLAERFDSAPMPGLDGSAFRWLTFISLYNAQSFTATAENWKALLAGKPPTAPQPPQSAGPPDNFPAALNAITCADMTWSGSVPEYQEAVRADSRRYPAFGAMMASAWACAGWHSEPREPAIKLTDKGPENILLLQNTKDPATVHSGAVSMNKVLGKRSTMVSVDEVGHGVYLHAGNTCAADYATRFLLGGALPDGDRFCAAETPLPNPRASGGTR